MARITQQTLIALYGEVLTLAEIVEMLHEVLDQAAQPEFFARPADELLSIADSHRRAARKAQQRAVDILIDRFPQVDLHPLTGDVIDPPPG